MQSTYRTTAISIGPDHGGRQPWLYRIDCQYAQDIEAVCAKHSVTVNDTFQNL